MANRVQLRLLKTSVQAFNDWRDEEPDARVNLAGADLAGCDLAKANLEDADLFGANLEGANLDGAKLCKAILVDACLDNVRNLESADLTRARGVKREPFKKEELAALLRRSGSEFKIWLDEVMEAADDREDDETWRADISGCDLAGIRVVGLDTSVGDDEDCRDLTFANAHLPGAVFEQCHFGAGTSFREANLRHAVFRDVLIWDTDFRGANLSGAMISGKIDSQNGVSDARPPFEGACLDGADLSGLTWEDNMDGGELRDFLRGADITNCLLPRHGFLQGTKGQPRFAD